MFRLILGERARPGSLIVDGSGRRFANEAQNYNDFGRTLQNFNPGAFRFPHVPAWMIFDYAVRTSLPARPAQQPGPGPGLAGPRRDGGRPGAPASRRTAGPGSDGPAFQRRREHAARTPTSGAAATRTTASSAAGRARRRSVLRGQLIPGCLRPRAAHDRLRGRVRSVNNGHRSLACTPLATSRRAASGWPIPAPAGRSALRSCSACAPATPPLRTDPRVTSPRLDAVGERGELRVTAATTIGGARFEETDRSHASNSIITALGALHTMARCAPSALTRCGARSAPCPTIPGASYRMSHTGYQTGPYMAGEVPTHRRLTGARQRAAGVRSHELGSAVNHGDSTPVSGVESPFLAARVIVVSEIVAGDARAGCPAAWLAVAVNGVEDDSCH